MGSRLTPAAAAAAAVLALALASCKTVHPVAPAPVEDPSVASVGISFKSTGKKSKRAATRNGCYADLAQKILLRTGELRQRHPHFSHMDPEDLRWQEPIITNEKLWIAFRYENAIEWGPDSADPKTALHPLPKAYRAADAIALRMYFRTGPWTGEAGVAEKSIGDMKIVYFLDVADPAIGKKLGAEIDEIVADEAAHYDRKCGRPAPKR